MADGHHHGRGGMGGPGRGGHRRLFDHGELKRVVLALLAERPRHGYELIKELEERTGGAYAPSPGVIYPTLTMLEEMGLAAQTECAGAKKLYALTDEGRAQVESDKVGVEAVLDRIAAAGAARARGDDAPIMRAMTNLKMVLRNRLADADISRETLLAAAGIIDEAAGRIERL